MLKIIDGLSQTDRITFSTKDSCATAIRKENGEIDYDFAKENKSVKESIIALFVIFVLSSLVKAFVLVPFITKGVLSVGWYLTSLVFYSFLAILSVVVIKTSEGEET